MSRRRAAAGAPEGWLVIDKPSGLTSHDVVAAARRALGQPRIGHTGTLDPLATGVLPLLAGRATRLAQFLAAADKTYLATIQFGQATDSYDAFGDPVGTPQSVTIVRTDLEALLGQFVGPQFQTPPNLSAKKVGGKKAYELARSNRPVALTPVQVEVTDLSLVECSASAAVIRVSCSAGFYVRTLAHDLGVRLGVGAHLAALRRERSGRLSLADSITLERLVGPSAHPRDVVRPMADLLSDWPSMTLTPPEVLRVRHGQPVETLERPETAAWPGLTRLLDASGGLVGLSRYRAGFLHPVLVLV